MDREQALQLFDFEVSSSENLLYIPLSVRFHLDHAGLRISLDDWQRLPHQERVALASFPVDADGDPDLDTPDRDTPDREFADQSLAQFSGDFAKRLSAAMQAYTGHLPEAEEAGGAMSDDTHGATPDNVARQCEMAGLTTPDSAAWSSLTRFQRYALVKLSRKSKANHDFIPAMTEFGLARPR